MSQQQNPDTVSRSLLQEMDSEEPNAEAEDVKPFSIRDYVVGCRERKMIHSWPFHEKYLQMCLNLGIRDVLPPFGPQANCSPNSSASSLKVAGCSSLVQLEDDYKNTSKLLGVEFCKTEEEAKHTEQDIRNNESAIIKVTTNNTSSSIWSHEEEENYHHNQHNCSNVSVNKNVTGALIMSHPIRTPTLAVKSDKRRKRRGNDNNNNRCKKRSMVDILAVARHCTLEEIHRMNKFCYTNTDDDQEEECHQKMEPNFDEEEHDQVANFDINGKGSLFVKFKLNGCDNNVNHN